jgi:hypothetical protein
MGGEGKKSSQKKNQPGLSKGKKKGQLEFVTFVSPGTARDEKGAPMSAPSIHIGPLVGAGSLWPNWRIVQGIKNSKAVLNLKV